MLKGIRFSYIHPEDSEDHFHTMEFYKVDIRNFLKGNQGKAVWLVGAKIEKAAYMLYEETCNVNELFTKSSAHWSLQSAEPEPLIERYRNKRRVIRGKLDSVKFEGLDPDEEILELANPFEVGKLGDYMPFQIEHEFATINTESSIYKKEQGGTVLFYNAKVTYLDNPGDPIIYDKYPYCRAAYELWGSSSNR